MLKHLEMKCNRKASFHPCELDPKTPEKKYDSSENVCDSISNEAFDNASDASSEEPCGYPLTHLTPFLNMLPLTTPLMLRKTSPAIYEKC